VVKEYGELPPVECYAGQLNQVFMNVFSNAIDALEEAVVAGCWALPNVVKPTSDATQTSGPTIWIYTTWVGEHVTIGIRDNGPGIPEPVRVKLFEPFFTTKPVGKGTGLGLSISHQIIVQQHRGELECISRLGEGTEFRIQVPVSHSQVSQISC
jgi:signal transduction histidine kinase